MSVVFRANIDPWVYLNPYGARARDFREIGISHRDTESLLGAA